MNRPISALLILFICSLYTYSMGQEAPQKSPSDFWLETSSQNKPGAYWWQPGSAVTREGIAANIRRAAENGLGTLHIIPIYGVVGNEANDLPFLSQQWLDMLNFTVEEGRRQGVEIHFTLGTGWCFGGPHVTPEDSVTQAQIVRDSVSGEIQVKLRRKRIAVKRAAPGGEGPMLDPFSLRSIQNYTRWFDENLLNYKGALPAASYHDSYEYFSANWSDELYSRFEQMNGYRLQDNLDIFLPNTKNAAENSSDAALNRLRIAEIKADYRRTLAEMHLDFIKYFVQWSHKKGMQTRNEAHGSPANLLDGYAAADMPETEFFLKDKDILFAKFASSAAHVFQRKYITSETGTWLEEHFQERPGSMKVLIDALFLSGVNRIFYHGNCYSPENAPWPGWLFYASTEMNPRNTLWSTFGQINKYAARTQAFLQSGVVENEVLVYWNPEDYWHNPQNMELPLTVGNTAAWFNNRPTERFSRRLWEEGITFDYLSDKGLNQLEARNNRIYSGCNSWRVLVIPPMEYIDANSLAAILNLSRQGAEVIVDSALPKRAVGWKNLDVRQEELNRLKSTPETKKLVYPDAVTELNKRLHPQSDYPYLGSDKLKYVSRRLADGHVFFIANISQNLTYNPQNPVLSSDKFYTIPVQAQGAILLNPADGAIGAPEVKTDTKSGRLAVRISLDSNESILLRTFDSPAPPCSDWTYHAKTYTNSVPLSGQWKVEFLSGGPTLPPELKMTEPKFWTDFGSEYEHFSGTARYTLQFNYTGLKKGEVKLNLGDVRDAVRVKINGHDLGVRFLAPVHAYFPAEYLQSGTNVLELEITNCSANRLRWLDKSGAKWRIFKDINIVGQNYQPLNPQSWSVFPAGISQTPTLEF